MRKLNSEEYRHEWKQNQRLLEQELHSCMKILSLSDADIQAALKKVKKELAHQSITTIRGITITATVENILVDTLTEAAELVQRTFPLYQYHVQYSFFKLLRENAGMTFDEMAAMIHVSEIVYVQWEKEDFTPETWIQKLILEKYKIETFKRKMRIKIPNLSEVFNIICMNGQP